MTGVHDVTPEVSLRSVEDRDLDVFFEHQADPHKPVAIMGAADTGPNLL